VVKEEEQENKVSTPNLEGFKNLPGFFHILPEKQAALL
jgi:hypothetical protein